MKNAIAMHMMTRNDHRTDPLMKLRTRMRMNLKSTEIAFTCLDLCALNLTSSLVVLATFAC